MKPNRPPPAFRAAFFRGHGAAAALRSRAGFTMIEMLIVIALLGILLAFALPSFNGTLQRYRTSAAANQIANALQFARAEAIRTRANIRVWQTGTLGGCTLLPGAGAADWHCGVDVQNPNATPPALLKTLPSSTLYAVNVQIAGNANNQLIYSSMGYTASDVGTNTPSNVDSFIYVWPAALGNNPTTLPANAVINTVCATAAGKVRVVPRFVNAVGNCIN